MMNEYQQQIIDLYHNPLNFGKPAKFTNSFKMSNLSCGDEITVYLTVTDEVVQDVKFEGEGCSISIASASLLTEFIKGKKVSDVVGLDQSTVLDLLGIPLTTARLKCATLPMLAIHKSLEDSN